MYQELIRPLLDQIGHSEGMHTLARDGILHELEKVPGSRFVLEHLDWGHSRVRNLNLAVDIDGIQLDNPLLLAAGWDKNATAVEAESALGFGGIVIGGVLEHPQYGNPKPRQWAKGDMAVNYIGLASKGLDVVISNLRRYQNSNIPILANVANNHDIKPETAPDAFANVVKKLNPFVKGYEICICPNRDETFAFMDYSVVKDIGQAMKTAAKDKPIYLKTLPDMDVNQLMDFVKALEDANLQGFVCSNTTKREDIKNEYKFSSGKPGGFSGPDIRYRLAVLEQIAFLRKTIGDKLTIIGVGGIQNGVQALEAIWAGANAVEGNTGMRGRGLTYPSKLTRELSDLLTHFGGGIRSHVGIQKDHYIVPMP